MPLLKNTLSVAVQTRNAAFAMLGAALWLACATAAAQTDADFLAAKDAFEHGDKQKLAALAPGLKGHLLAPYVTYWQLKAGIDDADYDAVRAFLTGYAGSPLAAASLRKNEATTPF